MVYSWVYHYSGDGTSQPVLMWRMTQQILGKLNEVESLQKIIDTVIYNCSDGMKSGALAEWRFFEVSSYVWPKPMFFPKFQRPADWSDHPSSATEDHLRDKRKAAKLPKHGRKRKRAQTLANKDRQRWRSKWITFNSMLEFRNVGKNRKACKTIGGSLIWCALDWSNKLPARTRNRWTNIGGLDSLK